MNYTGYVLKRGAVPTMHQYSLNDGVIRLLADLFREIAVAPYTLDMCMLDAQQAAASVGADMNLTNIQSITNHAWTSNEAYAWCRTCNLVEPGSGNFGKGATTLPQLLWAGHRHLGSPEHRERWLIDQERAQQSAVAAEADRCSCRECGGPDTPPCSAEQCYCGHCGDDTLGAPSTGDFRVNAQDEPCTFHGPDDLCPVCTS